MPGKDPVLSFWDVSRMRGDLAKCLEDKKLSTSMNEAHATWKSAQESSS